MTLEKDMANKSGGRLLLVPEGGLANRMRTIASAYEHCKRIGSQLKVVWFETWGIRAPFSKLFESVDDEVMTIREGSFTDRMLYENPRRHNLWIPKIAQPMLFERRIYAKEMIVLKNAHFDFEAWGRGKRCYMSSYHQFNEFPDALYASLFKPVEEVRRKIDDNISRLGTSAIGMHIRRTDNKESIEKSPLSLFVEKGKEELRRNANTTIFLATDSEEVKREMRGIFGNSLITPQSEATRESVEGIRDGIVDLWTLSACRHIYGSVGSTFSTMAASLSDGKAHYESLSV